MCWAAFLKNTRGISRKSGWRKLCCDTGTGHCIPTVCMAHAASPLSLRHETKGESVKNCWFNVVIDQVISIWFWFKEIHAILNCCLYTEGLTGYLENSLPQCGYMRKVQRWEDFQKRKSCLDFKMPVLSFVLGGNILSGIFERVWRRNNWLRGNSNVRRCHVSFQSKSSKLSYWKLSPALKLCHRLERQHIFRCLIVYQFNATGQQWWKVFLWRRSARSWLTCCSQCAFFISCTLQVKYFGFFHVLAVLGVGMMCCLFFFFYRWPDKCIHRTLDIRG